MSTKLRAKHGSRAGFGGVVAALALALATPAAACEVPLIGRGVPATADADGDLRLEDGRRVRLAGVALDPGLSAALASAIAESAIGRPVVLNGPPAADRYGRLAAIVRFEPGAPSLQQVLVERGLALVRPEEGVSSCLPALLQAEAKARRARLGLWAASLPNAADVEAIRRHSGRFLAFEGEILAVGEGRSVDYLNFGPVWRQDVTVRVPREQRAAFIAAGKDPAGLAGRKVRVRGTVFEQDGPAVEARWPEQIEVEGDAGQ